MREKLRRFAALWLWSAAVWLLLTWTATAEQLVFGALLSTVVALSLSSLGPVGAPWLLFTPRRFIGVVRLLLSSLLHIARANLSLARRIWLPSRPLRSGMIVVPTQMRSDGELAAVGLISSLIVDNQIVDLHRSEQTLQYHSISVPEGDMDERVEAVNGPTEKGVTALTRSPGRGS